MQSYPCSSSSLDCSLLGVTKADYLPPSHAASSSVTPTIFMPSFMTTMNPLCGLLSPFLLPGSSIFDILCLIYPLYIIYTIYIHLSTCPNHLTILTFLTISKQSQAELFLWTMYLCVDIELFFSPFLNSLAKTITNSCLTLTPTIPQFTFYF